MSFINKTGQGNNKKQVNINTRGIQLMNKDGFDPSTMMLGFWNDLITITIHPTLEKSQQTEKQIYDYNTSYMTQLTVEKIQVLLHALRTKIRPAMEEGKDASVGVRIGSNNMVLLGTGVKHTGDVRPFIGIFKELDENNISESMICYEFAESEIIEDYDPGNGTSSNGQYNAQLDVFENFLLAGLDALTHASVHSDRHVNNYFRTSLLEAVGAKQKPNSFSAGPRNPFASSKSDDAETANETLENEDTLNSFMS